MSRLEEIRERLKMMKPSGFRGDLHADQLKERYTADVSFLLALLEEHGKKAEAAIRSMMEPRVWYYELGNRAHEAAVREAAKASNDRPNIFVPYTQDGPYVGKLADPENPQNPPPGAYCPCCKRLSDCCICRERAARYYGEECPTCLPLTNPTTPQVFLDEAAKRINALRDSAFTTIEKQDAALHEAMACDSEDPDEPDTPIIVEKP